MYGIYALVSLERIIISSVCSQSRIRERSNFRLSRSVRKIVLYSIRSRSDIRRYTTFFFLIDYCSRYNNYHRPFILRPFRKRQQQQQQHTLPFLWIFPPFPLPPSLSLPPLLPLVFPSLSSLHLSTSPLSFPRWKGPRRISEGLVESRKLCSGWHTRSQKEASQVIARPTGR